MQPDHGMHRSLARPRTLLTSGGFHQEAKLKERMAGGAVGYLQYALLILTSIHIWFGGVLGLVLSFVQRHVFHITHTHNTVMFEPLRTVCTTGHVQQRMNVR